MFQTVLSSGSGKNFTDAAGRNLVAIGNVKHAPGDAVWTDGKCIYGWVRTNKPDILPEFGGTKVEGIPLCGERGFYILNKTTGARDVEYTFSDSVLVFGFIADEKKAYIEIRKDDVYTWYDVETGEAVISKDAASTDAQISGDALLTLELYAKDKALGLYRQGSMNIALPTANEIATTMGSQLVAKVQSLGGAYPSWGTSIGGHVGRITKGDVVNTYLLNYSGRASFRQTPPIELVPASGSRPAVTTRFKGGNSGLRGSGSAYTVNGEAYYIQDYSMAYGGGLIANGAGRTVDEQTISFGQSFYLVSTWNDPFLPPAVVAINGVREDTATIPNTVQTSGMYSQNDYETDAEWSVAIDAFFEWALNKANEYGIYYDFNGFRYYNEPSGQTNPYYVEIPLNDNYSTKRVQSGDYSYIWEFYDGGTRIGSNAVDGMSWNFYKLNNQYPFRPDIYLASTGMGNSYIYVNQEVFFAAAGGNFRPVSVKRADKIAKKLEKFLKENFDVTMKKERG